MTTQRNRLSLAISAIVLVAGACSGAPGQSPTADATSTSGASAMPTTAAPTVSAEPSATPILDLPSPLSTVDPNWPGKPLPAGVTVVDGAASVAGMDWSPDGKLLAILTWGGVLGTGRADVLDLSGRKVASYPAFDMAWVDGSHLMTFTVSPDSIWEGTVADNQIGGTAPVAIPGVFGGILGNGHGSVALMANLPPGTDQAEASFQIWADGQIGPLISGYGRPTTWSSDGRLLALVGNPTAAHAVARAIFAAAGSPEPGTITVLQFPAQSVLASFPLADVRNSLYFSPDGKRIAISDGEVMELARSGAISKVAVVATGWTPRNELVIADAKARLSLWTPTGTTAIPNAFSSASFGPGVADFAAYTAPLDQYVNAPTVVVRHGGSSVTIGYNANAGTVAWSSGGICFVATWGIDAQREDSHVLRIQLP